MTIIWMKAPILIIGSQTRQSGKTNQSAKWTLLFVSTFFFGTSKANPYKNIAFLCALMEKLVNFEGPRAEWSVVTQPTGLHHGAPIRLVNPSIDTCFSCFLKHVDQLWKILNMQNHSLQHFNCAFFNLVFNFREFNISYIHFVGSISTQRLCCARSHFWSSWSFLPKSSMVINDMRWCLLTCWYNINNMYIRII